MKHNGMIRTVLVFCGGFLLFVVATALLEYIFSPDSFYVLHKVITGVPDSQMPALLDRLDRAAKITVFVVRPLGGLLVGVFVGLLQRKGTVTVAVCCLIPDWILSLIDDPRKVWAHSAKGIAIYGSHHALPFATAAIAAAAVRYILARRTAAKTESPSQLARP
jgi:hypothetical protein